MRRRQLPGEGAEHEPSMDLRKKVDDEVTELVMTAYKTAKDVSILFILVADQGSSVSTNGLLCIGVHRF